MTSLEFIRNKISKKIKTINEKRNFMTNCKQMNIPFNSELTYDDEKELEYLRQVESELEAWEVVKPYVDIIDKYTPYPTWQLKPNYDECKLKETNILIKALEVEDES